MNYGEGNYRFRPIEGWGTQIKERWPNIQEIAGVTVDDEDCVYLLTRTDPPVIKTDRSGNVLCTFGQGVFTRPHGIYVTRNGSIFGVDDKAHTVYRFDEQFHLVQTLGTPGKASDTGSSGKYTEVTRGGPPFNRPTRICEDKDGNLYVTDGYGNARVHKFSCDGTLIKSWGEPGTASGQFNLPHGIGIDKNGVLYVADRQNHRVQRFTTEGAFIDEWTGLHRPSDIWIDRDGIIFVPECKRTSEFDDSPSRVSIFDDKGHLLSRLERETTYDPELGSRCAHGVATDSRGDLYVTEVGKKLSESFFGIRKYQRA